MAIREWIRAERALREVARRHGVPVSQVKAAISAAIREAHATASPTWTAADGSRRPSPAELVLDLAAATQSLTW